MWIGRPAADRETALRETTDMIGLVRNASEVSSSVLHALLQAQADLIGKMGREACPSMQQRQKLADLAVQQLAILVKEADSIPGKTGEALSKTHLLLEAVQKMIPADEQPDPSAASELEQAEQTASQRARAANGNPEQPARQSSHQVK